MTTIVTRSGKGTALTYAEMDANLTNLNTYVPAGTGAVATTVQAKLRESISVKDFGAALDGVTDDTAKFTAAMASLPAGGIVNFTGWAYIAGPLSIPDGVTLSGDSINVGQKTSGVYTPATISSALVLNTANTITLNNRCGVQNCLVITRDLAPGGSHAMPFANSTVATAAVAAFAGTAFTPAAVVTDQRLENILVLGFNWLYDSRAVTSLNRPLMRRVYGDCTNGISMQNVFDLGRCEDCEMWEFTTTNQSFTTDALIVRTGTAFYTGPGSVGMKWQDCFQYGWAIGHDVNGVQSVQQINCGSDSPPTLAQSNVGFQYRGSIGNAEAIGCFAWAQGDCGFKLNSSVQNNVNDVKIIGPVCYGNNSANGYVHVMQGTYSIVGGFFSDNSAVGQIKLDAGVGSGSVVSCTFANMGAVAPIFGNATAILAMQLVAPVYAGTTTPYKQPLPTWTPGISFGGASVGVTYSTQLGTYQINGRLVTCNFRIILTSKGSSTGGMKITGLPFAISTAGSLAGNHGAGIVAHYANFSGLTGALFLDGDETLTTCSVNQTSAAGGAAVLDTNATNTLAIYGSFSYFV